MKNLNKRDKKEIESKPRNLAEKQIDITITSLLCTAKAYIRSLIH